VEIVIYHFRNIDSTNLKAVRMAEQGAKHGTVIHADMQSGGKGRGGRQFMSPPGGLYFSLILKPQLTVEKLTLVTLAAGVGICQEIALQTSLQVELKWPNDLYVQGRKLGGILTETAPVSQGRPPEYIVIGIGINVSTDLSRFPSSLRNRVISLYHAGGNQHLSMEVLLSSFSESVISVVKLLESDPADVLALWRKRDYLQGMAVEYVGQSGTISATGVGLAEDGQYIIRDQNGKESSILAGDINPIRLYR